MKKLTKNISFQIYSEILYGNQMSSKFMNSQVGKRAAKKRAWVAFSMYMRTFWNQGGSVPCYTCGNETVLKGRPGVRTMAGHWVEGHSAMTYVNEIYVRPQCYKCNMMMGGNQGEFRDRIRKELGDKEVDRLLVESKKTLDVSVKEWLQKQAYYKEALAKLTT